MNLTFTRFQPRNNDKPINAKEIEEECSKLTRTKVLLLLRHGEKPKTPF
jgi:hypothetical protein